MRARSTVLIPVAGLMIVLWSASCTVLYPFDSGNDGPALLFTDQFDGGLASWSLTPDDYWSVHEEQLVTVGVTPGNWGVGAASAELPPGAHAWAADVQVFADPDDQPAVSSWHGIAVASADGRREARFGVNSSDQLWYELVEESVLVGSLRIGSTDRLLVHRYGIEQADDGTFSFLLDRLRQGEPVDFGGLTAWEEGFGAASLEDAAINAGETLGTRFDNATAR